MKQTAVSNLIDKILPFIERSLVSDMMLQDIIKTALQEETEQLCKEYDRGYNEAWDETSPVEKELMIDPPSGWKYGFPKPIPQDRLKDSKVWLVEQGYPQSEIDSLGEHFYCRYWEK